MKKAIWFLVSFLIILSMLLPSCAPATPTPTQKTTPTATTAPTSAPSITPTSTAAPVQTTDKVTLKLTKLDGTIVTKTLEKPKYGGTITTVHYQDPSVFDPNDGLSAGAYFTNVVYEKLQTGDWTRSRAGTGEYTYNHFFYIPLTMRTGQIAESWEQPDGKTVIWHIRKGIKWQNVSPINGRELTADDVAYSINRQKSSPRIAPKYWGMLESVEVKDKYTIIEHLKYPDYLHLETTGDGNVCPVYAKEVVDKFGGKLTDFKSVIGTGPWMMFDYVRGSVVTYKKNPDYWGKDPLFPENTLPYASGLKVLVIPDISTQMSAMRTGKLDVLFQSAGVSGLSWVEAENLKKTSPEINQIGYISSAGSLSIMLRVDQPPLNDIRVRQALTIAIDQNTVLKDFLKGGELLGFPIMSSWTDVYTQLDKLPTEPKVKGSKCSARELFNYNPTKAKQLLTEAGYPNGFKLNCYLTDQEVESTSLVKAYWQAIGVDLTLQVRDPAVKAEMVQALPRKYDGTLRQQVQTPGPFQVWSSEYITMGSRNVGNISEEYIDKVYLDMFGEPDQAKRNQMCKDLSLYVIEQAYKILGPNGYIYNFWQPWLKNSEGSQYMTGWGVFQSLAYVWLDQDMKEKMTGLR